MKIFLMSDRKYRHETARCNLSKSFYKDIRIAVNNYLTQGIPQQQGTWQITCLIVFFPRLLCFQNWKCQSESKIWLCFAYCFIFCTLNCSKCIGNQNKGVRMKILGILHDFRIFFIGKGSFYRTLGMLKKFPALLL